MVFQFHPALWCGRPGPCLVRSSFRFRVQKNEAEYCVNQFLQVPDWPDVWAVGDCAFVPDIRNPGKSHPPTAQHAIREGKIVAQNIAAALLRRPLKSFSFKTIGLLASIGRRMGVARIFGFNFSGFFAWWIWRTIYLSKLPGLDKKVRVAFDWTLDLLFPKDVCAVYDLDHDGRNFRWPGQGKNTTRNKDDYQSARSLRVDRSVSGAFQKTRRQRSNAIVDQVVANYVRSLLAVQLVDVVSSDQDTVKPWFDSKIDFAPEVRDLSANGFPLVGGRLDYLDGKTVVALVYQRNKHPINLFITPEPTSRSTSPTVVTRRGYNVFSWTNNGMKCWAVSDLNQAELREFTELVRAVK